MIVKKTPRSVPVLVSLLWLTGCVAGPEAEPAPVDAYFARDLPGLPQDWDPMMSPVDNPIREARHLQNPPPALIRRALLAQHRRWVGTPYRLGGESEHGIDCSALVQSVFNETFRLALPRTTRGQVRTGVSVDRDELRPGDLVFFRPPGLYRHVGIYVGDGHFLHASTSRGVMLSDLDDRYWQRHYWQARRALAPARLAQRLVERGEG